MGVLKYENEYRPHADGFKCSVRRPRRRLLKNRGCRASHDSLESGTWGISIVDLSQWSQTTPALKTGPTLIRAFALRLAASLTLVFSRKLVSSAVSGSGRAVQWWCS